MAKPQLVLAEGQRHRQLQFSDNHKIRQGQKSAQRRK
jgi:hypothetical protein